MKKPLSLPFLFDVFKLYEPTTTNCKPPQDDIVLVLRIHDIPKSDLLGVTNFKRALAPKNGNFKKKQTIQAITAPT